MFKKTLYFIVSLLLLANCAALTITKDTALDISIPYDSSVNNDYSDTGFELPSGEWTTLGAQNVLWFHIAASTEVMTIKASTCTTSVDTIIGIYYYVSGQPIGQYNDDRVLADSTCDLLSSLVEVVIPANTDFYVVVGAYYASVGDIDLSIEEYIGNQDLLSDTETTVINSVKSVLDSSEASLQVTISQISSDVSASNSQLSNAIDIFHQAIDDQFTQVQINIALSGTDLVNENQAAAASILGQLSTLSTNVANVPTDVTTIKTATAATSTDAQSLLTNVANLESSMTDITSNIAALAASVDSVSTSLSGINGNIATLSSESSSRFDSVDATINAVKSDTTGLISQVNAGNLISQDTFGMLGNVLFEKYLAGSSMYVTEIPWKFRVPASYGGQMDDLFTLVVSDYNEKLAACSSSSSEACVWFTSNTASYNTFVTTYNSMVSAKKFKKAFDAIQTFYLKLYPTSLFV